MFPEQLLLDKMETEIQQTVCLFNPPAARHVNTVISEPGGTDLTREWVGVAPLQVS